MENYGFYIIIAIFLLFNVFLVYIFCTISFFPNRRIQKVFGYTESQEKQNSFNLPFLNEDTFNPLILLDISVLVTSTIYIFNSQIDHEWIILGIFLILSFFILFVAVISIIFREHAISNTKDTHTFPLLKALLAFLYSKLINFMPETVRDFRLYDAPAISPIQLGVNKENRQEIMLKGIIQFGNETVKDILTSKLDVVDLDIRMPFSKVLQIISDNKYSRLPVYSGSKDNIVGILYIKDLLPYLNKPSKFRWSSLIRSHLCVPETKKIDNLLHEFQTQKIHIAIVIDEYGGVTGVVTLEDIIEEIVGEINDEYDDDRLPYVKLDENTYIFDAKISIQSFCKLFNIEESFFDEFGEDADTLAGLLLEIVGDIPHKNQQIKYKQFDFEIFDIDERHISKIKLTFIPQPK